jgi:hypothetical protein
MCIDYRKLNKITEKFTYPLPIIEEHLSYLAGSQFYCKIDLLSGYYQVPVEKGSQKYTAFSTTSAHYEFLRCPFGLTNGPSVFQSIMDKLARKCKPGEILIYMDDILIPSTTIEDGFLKLELKMLMDAKLTINLKKCRFFETSLEYLGYEINRSQMRPGELKTVAVKEFKRPTNVHEVRQFLGLTGYFRKFVEKYGIIASPLTELTKREAEFVWLEEQEQAFRKLKNNLINRPILVLFDPKAEHEVHTDACGIGIAGILLQREQGEKGLRAVAYYSRRLSENERKYHSYELETLAVVDSIERFKIYLLGRQFKVFTDCVSVAATFDKKNMVPRIGRWVTSIQHYKCDILHRPGRSMQHVDSLSRKPVGKARETEMVDLKILTIQINNQDWLITMQQQDHKLKTISDSDITEATS